MLGVERSRRGLEAFSKRSHIFLRHHTDILPVFLDFLHRLVLVLPEHFCILNKFFNLCAQGFLVGQVLHAFRIHFFDKGGAVFLDLFVVALEVIAIFLQLGSRNGSNFLPAVRNFLQLLKNGLATGFLGQGIHFEEQVITVLFIVPIFPLLHFLEAGRRGLVFLPQVVVLELVLANDFLPLQEAFTNLLVQFAEVLVFIEGLDLFDDCLELFGIFFEALLGIVVIGGNLDRKLVAQRIVFLQHWVFTFQQRKLFPFADNGVQMLVGHVVNVGIGKSLKAFQQFRSNRFVGAFRDFFDNFFRLVDFLDLEESVVITLDQGSIHQGLAFGPIGKDSLDTFRVFGRLASSNQAFKFFEACREGCNLRLLFGFGLFGGDAGSISFVAEFLEAFIHFINCCLLVTHTEVTGFAHQFLELGLHSERILLGSEIMSLFHQGFTLARQEFGRLLAVIFGVALCTELFGNGLTNFGLLGILCNILQQRFRFHLGSGSKSNACACVAASDIGKDRLLFAKLHQFATDRFGGVHALQQFFGIMSILEVLQIRQVFGARFGTGLQLLDNLFLITGLCGTLHVFVGIFLRNFQQRRNDIQLLYGRSPDRSIGIGTGNTVQDILVVQAQFSDRFKALGGVGILPLRFKGVK